MKGIRMESITKKIKPFKKLAKDLLSTKYYQKHKEESIMKQFYL